MPRREDIRSVLILGSGPIVIGQACEFDYSGTQAAKALKEKGIRVVLLNSNPATIMTDPDLADATYVEPMTVPVVQKILEKEKPDAILPTVGGQTALNLALACNSAGLLEKYNVELIGAKVDAIKKAEDRELFKKAMEKIGVRVPASGLTNNLTDAVEIKKNSDFLSSFVPRSLSAVPEAESPTPRKLLRKLFRRVSRLLRSVRFFWKNRFWVGRNSNSKLCAIWQITWLSSVRSRTSIRWEFTREIPSPLPLNKLCPIRNIKT